MRILLLHLSDMHFRLQSDISFRHIFRIIDSLHQVEPFNQLVIFVSGDIAHSGEKNQYFVARKFFGNLITTYKNKYPDHVQPKLLIVPGNHDVDLSQTITHADLQEKYRNGTVETLIDTECEKQKNYLEFSKSNGCFSLFDRLFCRKSIIADGFSIEINLLNSALFSMLDEEKGLHYFPNGVFHNLSIPTEVDFVISVMHHSFHWFNDDHKNRLENLILAKSNLVFFGHEHNPNTQYISLNEWAGTYIFAGGCLCNKGMWEDSEFNTCVLDTLQNTIEVSEFKWDKQNQLYVSTSLRKYDIEKRHTYNSDLFPTRIFENEFYKDNKNPISTCIFDYFVFPRIQRQMGGEYTGDQEYVDEKIFLAAVLKHKHIYIVGGDNAGKTALLKRLFKLLLRDKVVIFCGVDDIRTGNRRSIVKRVFQDTYGDGNAIYSKFLQTEKSRKVIIIDDVHRINDASFTSFIKDIELDFDYIILGSRTVVELDIVERMRMGSADEYYRYQILPFYSDKRKEMIKKLICCCSTSKCDCYDNSVDIISDALSRQRKLINFNPHLIIQYVRYYCQNIHEAASNDVVFGKVFEANITNAIAPYAKRITVDKLYIVLDKIAYAIHKAKAYPISQDKLAEVISQYNEEHNSKIGFASFIEMLTEAKILVACNNDTAYRFNNKSHLAYFVAREIKRLYTETGDPSDLKNIIEYACFGINTDILLSITYITDNVNLLHTIINTANLYVKDWIEFDLDIGNVPFISNYLPPAVGMPTKKDIAEKEKESIEEEKEEALKNELLVVELYDYNEDESEKVLNQILRAYSLMSIVSRCLPNFEHLMKKTDIEQFVNAIYRLPLKMFYKWANNVEQQLNELVKVIREIKRKEYLRKKRKQITDEDIKKMLQEDSICLFLDILNNTVIYSTMDNTIDHLEKFDYKSAVTHQIQHLMMMERRERKDDFIFEASEIYDNTKNPIIKNIILRILQHFLIYSKRIDAQTMQKLEGKFYGEKRDWRGDNVRHRYILAQRKLVARK